MKPKEHITFRRRCMNARTHFPETHGLANSIKRTEAKAKWNERSLGGSRGLKTNFVRTINKRMLQSARNNENIEKRENRDARAPKGTISTETCRFPSFSALFQVTTCLIDFSVF